MGELRLNSEKKIQHNNFRLKIGTVNRLDPVAIYIEGNTFIVPILEKESYVRDINMVLANFKQAVLKMLKECEFLNNNFIINTDIAKTGMKYQKASGFAFQILVKQLKEPLYNIKEIVPMLSPLLIELISKFEDSLKEYDFENRKTKKKY